MPAYILIVDDDENVRLTLRAMLEDAGYDIGEACDGIAGLKAALARRPDVILADIVMPSGDGLSFIRDLVNWGYDGPVLAMSGTPTAGRLALRDFAVRLGATDALRKPFTRDQLLSKVGRALQASQPANGIASGAADSASSLRCLISRA